MVDFSKLQFRHKSEPEPAPTPDWLRRFIVIDLETTGLDPFRDRIIELGFALYEDGKLATRGDYFVDPEGRTIPERITQLTGIGVEHVMDAPPFYHVYNQLAPHLYGSTPVAYNAPFDRKFLMHAVFRSWPRHSFHALPPALELNRRWVDVLGLARAFLHEMHKHKLGDVAWQVGVPLTEQHRADEDCIVTAEILKHFVREWNRWDWSYERTIDTARKANYVKARKTFFWKQKEREDKRWLPEGEPIMVYECDVCHEMQCGAYVKKGWTIPDYWAYYGRDEDQLLTCGAACDAAASWHASAR